MFPVFIVMVSDIIVYNNKALKVFFVSIAIRMIFCEASVYPVVMLLLCVIFFY